MNGPPVRRCGATMGPVEGHLKSSATIAGQCARTRRSDEMTQPSTRGDRVSLVAPAAHATVHGDDFRVTHPAQVVCGQSTAASAATIQNDLRALAADNLRRM